MIFTFIFLSKSSLEWLWEVSILVHIIDLLENYGKAYEYEDFGSIASYFDYPTTFKAPIGNTVLKDKEELIKFYKNLFKDNPA